MALCQIAIFTITGNTGKFDQLYKQKSRIQHVKLPAEERQQRSKKLQQYCES